MKTTIITIAIALMATIASARNIISMDEAFPSVWNNSYDVRDGNNRRTPLQTPEVALISIRNEARANSLAIHLGIITAHMKDQYLMLRIEFFDANGNPILDADGNIVSTGIDSQIPSEYSKNADLVLTINYSELHLRGNSPTTILYRISAINEGVGDMPLKNAKLFYQFTYNPTH